VRRLTPLPRRTGELLRLSGDRGGGRAEGGAGAQKSESRVTSLRRRAQAHASAASYW